LSNEDRTLGFSVLKPEDSGFYECIVENRIASDRRSIDVVVKSKLSFNFSMIILIIEKILFNFSWSHE
jgi:hypothetical protein